MMRRGRSFLLSIGGSESVRLLGDEDIYIFIRLLVLRYHVTIVSSPLIAQRRANFFMSTCEDCFKTVQF